MVKPIPHNKLIPYSCKFDKDSPSLNNFNFLKIANIEKILSCLSTNKPKIIPNVIGSNSIEKFIPAKVIPALAKAKTGSIK